MMLMAAHPADAQRIASFKAVNASLNDCMKQIERQTGLGYLSKGGDLNGIRGISYSARDTDVATVLRAILAGTGLTWEIDNKVILLIAAQKPDDASQRVLTGLVTDAAGQPLAGVAVAMKGTNLAAVTGENGRFTLRVPNNGAGIVTFSYVGMATQEFPVDKRQSYAVTMKEAVQSMEDVVVTGYANIKKESFTGTSTQIRREDLLKVSQGNILSTLQAFDPSLRMPTDYTAGSNPNVAPNYYIRGQSGIGQSDMELRLIEEGGDISQYSLLNNPNQPLFILDGYEVSMERIFDLDPNRVNTVTILKDAAATAMYGSRAANGIIVIETLAPKAGKLQVSYNFTGGVAIPDLSSYNLMDASGKLQAEVAAGLLDQGGSYMQRLNDYRTKEGYITSGVDTYWLSKPLRTQFKYNNNLYVEGGADAVRFGLGLNFGSDKGVMKESFRDRLGVDLKVDYRVKNFQITDNVTFGHVKSQDSPYGSFADYVKQQPYFSPYDLDSGELLKTMPEAWKSAAGKNPLYEASLDNFSGSGYNNFGNNLNVNGTFGHFMLKFQLSLAYQDNKSELFIDPRSATFERPGSTPLEQGSLQTNRNETFSWNTNLLLTYNNSVGKHNMNFSLGANAMQDQFTNEFNHYIGFPSSQLNSPKYAYGFFKAPEYNDGKSRLIGGFLMGNYTYDDIYLFDLSVRTDGSSKFGHNNRFAPFWSFGAGVNLHKYAFLRDNPVIDQAKIRANYGQMGRVTFPPYAARNMYGIMLDGWHMTGIGAQLMAMGNDNLTWDRSDELNIGLDMRLLGRLNFTFSWYNKITRSMVTNISIPSSSGFTSYTENMGDVRNRGFEFDANYSVLQTKDWNLNVAVRGAHNKNEILRIADALKQYNDRVDAYYGGYDKAGGLIDNSKYVRPLRKYEEGSSQTAIYGMRSLGISPANGHELFMNRDGSVSYVWDAAQQVVVGDTEPAMHGSIALNLRYRKFTLYSTFMYEWGGDYYNSTLVERVESVDIWNQNVDRRVYTERWKKPGDVVTMKRIDDPYTTTLPTSRFVQRNNTFSLNSLSLGYEFDRELIRKAGLGMLRLQITTNDLFTLSTIKVERGTSYPYAHSVGFTVNASF